eukprot:782340-Pelagomonas_calceolata.AAC.5
MTLSYATLRQSGYFQKGSGQPSPANLSGQDIIGSRGRAACAESLLECLPGHPIFPSSMGLHAPPILI